MSVIKSITEEMKAAEAMEKAAMEKANLPGINPDFETLLDEQTKESYDELKKSIQAEGIRDPIVVWQEQNKVVDGHNRFKISKELGIACPTVMKSFKDEAEVKEWIIRNQLGRRNLTPARFQYYIGRLYNEQKAEGYDEKAEAKGNTAEKLADEFQISEKTIRRYGTQAKGIDAIERVRGKLAKAKQLSNKPDYTAEEVAAVAAATNTTVAAKTLKNIDDYKKVAKAKKVEDKAVKAAVAEKQTFYNVALCEPDFASTGYSVTTEPKPTLDKNAAVYMIVPDEHLADAMKLLDRWMLNYEATFVYWNNKPYDGAFSKICHQYLIMASKGLVVGPKAGKESPSCVLLNGDIGPTVVKLIDSYHNGNSKKLDMRRGSARTAGWDKP